MYMILDFNADTFGLFFMAIGKMNLLMDKYDVEKKTFYFTQSVAHHR